MFFLTGSHAVRESRDARKQNKNQKIYNYLMEKKKIYIWDLLDEKKFLRNKRIKKIKTVWYVFFFISIDDRLSPYKGAKCLPFLVFYCFQTSHPIHEYFKAMPKCLVTLVELDSPAFIGFSTRIFFIFHEYFKEKLPFFVIKLAFFFQ